MDYLLYWGLQLQMSMFLKKYSKLIETFYFLFLFTVLGFLNSASAFTDEKIKFAKVNIDFNRAIGAGFIQDRDGFFWIGSQTSLIKWNGFDKKIYTRSNSNLSDNTITGIIEDQKGQIWENMDRHNGRIE